MIISKDDIGTEKYYSGEIRDEVILNIIKEYKPELAKRKNIDYWVEKTPIEIIIDVIFPNDKILLDYIADDEWFRITITILDPGNVLELAKLMNKDKGDFTLNQLISLNKI